MAGGTKKALPQISVPTSNLVMPNSPPLTMPQTFRWALILISASDSAGQQRPQSPFYLREFSPSLSLNLFLIVLNSYFEHFPSTLSELFHAFPCLHKREILSIGLRFLPGPVMPSGASEM